MDIPKPPNILIFEKETPIPEDRKPFLRVVRKAFSASYPNGETSPPFFHDGVKRRLMDAVGIVAHTTISGVRSVYLRSCVRPNLQERFPEHVNLWEIAAGLIEDGEEPEVSAARETLEELGFEIDPKELRTLGPFNFSSPGLGGERLHFFDVEVDHEAQKKPTEDGGALEKYGQVQLVSLDVVMSAVRKGYFKDAKTEIALRRFADKVAR